VAHVERGHAKVSREATPRPGARPSPRRAATFAAGSNRSLRPCHEVEPRPDIAMWRTEPRERAPNAVSDPSDSARRSRSATTCRCQAALREQPGTISGEPASVRLRQRAPWTNYRSRVSPVQSSERGTAPPLPPSACPRRWPTGRGVGAQRQGARRRLACTRRSRASIRGSNAAAIGARHPRTRARAGRLRAASSEERARDAGAVGELVPKGGAGARASPPRREAGAPSVPRGAGHPAWPACRAVPSRFSRGIASGPETPPRR